MATRLELRHAGCGRKVVIVLPPRPSTRSDSGRDGSGPRGGSPGSRGFAWFGVVTRGLQNSGAVTGVSAMTFEILIRTDGELRIAQSAWSKITR